MTTQKVLYVLIALTVILGVFFALNRTPKEDTVNSVTPPDSMSENANTPNDTSKIKDASSENIIKMDSGLFYYTPNTLQAKVGEEVSIDITSFGLHTFTIDELGVDVPTKGGETTRVTFTPDKAGTYTYYCAIPGHKESGQVGILTVKE